MPWNPFSKKSWREAKAKVVQATPLNHNPESAITPFDAIFEVHFEDRPPYTVEQRLNVGRGRPFGANLWVAIRVHPKNDQKISLDWTRSAALQMNSEDAATRLAAAMAAGITDPEEIQRIARGDPAE